MYTDIIRYKLADEVTQEQLFIAADEILNSWMKKQPGFISWEINSVKDGYLDIVKWEDKDSAKAAEAVIKIDIPLDNAWYACYDFSSIKSDNTTQLKILNK